MEFKHYLLILGRRKWVVIITVLVTILVIGIGTQLMSPTYTANSILRIATASSSSSSTDYMFADRLITTYINIVTSRPLMDELDKQFGLTEPPKIDVRQIPNSELIQISVEDQNPNLAMLAANALGNLLITQNGAFYAGSGKTPSDVLKEQVDKAEADLNQMRIDYNKRLAQNPNDAIGNQGASKAVDSQQQFYFSLLSQYQQMGVRQAIQANTISFVETAILPTIPSSPNKPLNIALGLMVGFISGIVLAFLFENLDTILYTSDEIGAVTNLHPIGRIPLAGKSGLKKIPLDGNSFYGDAFLRLRTNLLTLIHDTPLRTLLIASALQGEGKTTVASSLAFALSQSNKKVILVDCDFRLPTVHKIFNLQNKTGLSNYLAGEAKLDQIIQGTKFYGLHVITGGQSAINPIFLLDSPQMKELVPTLMKNYDFVLFDSPALLAVTDSSVIAPIVDGVLLITKLGLIRKEKLIAVLEQIGCVKGNLIGCVINGDDTVNHYYYKRGKLKLKEG